MTDERMALIELIEKQADTDLACEIRAFAADRIMELETGAELMRWMPPPDGIECARVVLLQAR